MANPKILLLPGLDGDGFYLARLRGILSQDYTCEQFSYPRRQLNYEDLCEWICEQLDFNSDYVIFAESFGGPLAIRVAEILEEQAKGLILCATFCEPPSFRPALSFTAALYPRVMHFRWMEHVLNYFLWNGKGAMLARQLYRSLLETPDSVIAHRIRLLLRLDMRAASASLTLPCLVLQAKRDRLVRFRRFTHLNHARFTTLDGPHELAGVKPEQVAEAVLKFVKEQQ